MLSDRFLPQTHSCSWQCQWCCRARAESSCVHLCLLLHKPQLLLPVTPARPLGLPDCSWGQNNSYVLGPGVKPCPPVSSQNFSVPTGNATVNTYSSVKGTVILRYFLNILAGSGRMRGLLPGLCHLRRGMQEFQLQGGAQLP